MSTRFCLQADKHDEFSMKKHVLVCNNHKFAKENEKLLQKYKENVFLEKKLIFQRAAKV